MVSGAISFIMFYVCLMALLGVNVFETYFKDWDLRVKYKKRDNFACKMSNGSLEQALRDQVLSPDQQELIWFRLETYKKMYPEYCAGADRAADGFSWRNVGEERLPYSGRVDGYLTWGHVWTIKLLMQTYGMLTYQDAHDIAGYIFGLGGTPSKFSNDNVRRAFFINLNPPPAIRGTQPWAQLNS